MSSSSSVVDDSRNSVVAQMNDVTAAAAAAEAVGSSGSTGGSFLTWPFISIRRDKQQKSQSNDSFVISGGGGGGGDISATASNDDTNNDDDMDQQQEGRGKWNSMTKGKRITTHSVSNGKKYQALASSSSSKDVVQDLDQPEQQINPATSSITSITTTAASFKTAAATTATTDATVAVMTNTNKKKATTTTTFLSSRFPEKPRRYFDHMTDAEIWERFCSKPLASSSSSENVQDLGQQEQHGQQINPAAASSITPATSFKTAAANTATTAATVAVMTNKEKEATTTLLQQRRQQACASQGFTGNWIYTGVPPPPPSQRFVETPYVDVHMLNDRAKKEIQERFKMILEKRKFSTTPTTPSSPTTASSSNNTHNAFSASTSAADYKLRARKDFQERLRMLRKKRKFSSTASSSSNNTHNAHNAGAAATTTSSSSYSFNSRDLKRKTNPNIDSPTSVAASANATTSITSDVAVASTTATAAATSAGIAVPAAASTSSNSFYSFISRDLKKKIDPKNDSPTSVAASANATSIASNLAVASTTTATGIAVPAAATTTSNSFYSFNSRDLKKKTNPNNDFPTSVAASADATSTTSDMAVASTTTAATATGIAVLAAVAANVAAANAPLSTLKSTPSLSSSQPLVIDLLSSSSDNDDDGDDDDDDSSDDDDDRKPKANADAVVGSNCGKSVVKSPPRTLEDGDEDEAVRRSLDDIDIDEAVRRSLLDQQQPLRQQQYKRTSTTSSDESESNAESEAESDAESDAESEYVAKKVNNKNLNKFKQFLKDKENSNSKNSESTTKCTDTTNKFDADADADSDADVGENIDIVVVGEESKRCDTVEQQQQKIITVATAIVASPKAANDDFPSSPSILEEEVIQPWKEFQHNLKKRRNKILNPTTTKQKRDRSTSNPTMVAAAAATSSVTIPTVTAIANTGTSSGNDHDRVAITAATTTAGNSSGKDVDRSNTPHDSDKEDEMVDTSGADDSPRPPAGEGIPNDDDADAGDDDDGVLKIPLKSLVIDEDAYFKPNFRRQPTAEYNSRSNNIVIRFTYFGVSYPLVCKIAINMDHVDEKGCWTVFNNNHITATTLFKNGFMFIRVAENEIMNLHKTMKKGGHRNIMLEFENSQHLIKLLKMCSIKGIGTKILPIQYTPSEVESAVGSYDKPFKNIIRNDDYLSKSIHCLLRHHYSTNERKERVRKNIPTNDGDDDGGTAVTTEEPSPKKAKISGSITTDDDDDDDEALVDHSLLDVPTADGKKKEDSPTTTSPIAFTAVDEVFLSSNSIDDDDDDAGPTTMMMDSTIDNKGERKGVLPFADINNTSTTKRGEDKNKLESSLSTSCNVATGAGSDGNAVCRGIGNDDAAAAVNINIVNDPEEEETLLVINDERTTGSSVGRCVEICATTIRDVFSTVVDTVSDPCEERHQQIAKRSDDKDEDGPDSRSYLPTNNSDNEATPQELINNNDDDHDDDHRKNAQLDDGNSKKHIYLLMLPMIFLTGILLHIGLFAYIPTSVIVTKFVITLFRFIVMGLFLLPFGRLGVVENPMRIISYVVLLVAVASYEVSSRTKYTFDGQFYYIMGPIIFNVGWVLLLIFQGILGELRHVLPLPIVGMLVVSSIDSISSSLDIITTSLVENHVDELVPRFGNDATNYEAGNELFIHAIQESSMMPLNMIRDILIMGMLGMIGGRFFCGSKPIGTDVGCQMKIIFLIAVCTLSTILLNYVVMMELVLYSEQQVLCTDRFAKNHARSLIEVMVGVFAEK